MSSKTPFAIASSLAVVIALFIAGIVVPNLSAASSGFSLKTFNSNIPKTELTRAENEEIFVWVEEAADAVMNVRDRKYGDFLGDNRKYFTDAGWRSYYKALEVSRVLDGVKKGTMDMSATLDDTAGTRIISTEQDGQTYYWAKTPVTLKYEMEDSTKEMKSDFVVLITYQDGNPGIDQLIIFPRGEATVPVVK